MTIALSGATRLYIIVGDPIAQVKSPGGMTAGFAARGVDAVLVPVQVAPDDLYGLVAVADRIKNLDGIVVTVPHKFDCFRHCRSGTGNASFIGAANLMRRRPDGRWHAHMTDGQGFVRAMRAKGVDPAGKRALQVGAGGAGSAIAYALIDAGVAELALHDENPARRDALIARLNTLNRGRAVVGSANPAGFDLVCNATPSGMRPGDAPPVDLARLSPGQYVGCVITAPEAPPLILAARALGCVNATGTEMYQALQALMLDFLLTPMDAR